MSNNNRNRGSILSEIPLPSVPLTEIIGNKRVLIENHKGIIAYDSCGIHVKTSNGVICVEGSKLELNCISRERVIIIGKITGVCLNFRG